VRARLAQLERGIETAQTAASSAESIAVQKHEVLEHLTQEVISARKIADDANALLATKKTEHKKILNTVATDLQDQ
jgi:hypothetical protein